MPSPFPGMNPFIEKAELWRDFHTAFLTFFRSALMPQVVPKYVVRIEQHIYVDEPQAERPRVRIADIDVSRERGKRSALRNGHSAAAVLTPATKLRVPQPEKRKVGYLAIRAAGGSRILTVIELLSPSNKDANKDQRSYLVKRGELLAGDANFVEIDLLRGGMRMPISGLGECDYYTMVSRTKERPRVDVCRVRLRDRLPVIPIPLEPGVPEPSVDLQAVVDRVYDEAGYEYAIYDEPPEPPLSASDAAWARKLIPKAAR